MTATTVVDAATTAGRIRVLPAPCAEPPYDDELDHRPGARERHDCGPSQGALALSFTLPGGLPTVPAAPDRPPLRLVPTRGTRDESLPDPHSFAGRLVQALVEVAAGARPASQLIRWTTERVQADINAGIRRLASAGAPGKRGLIAGRLRSVHIREPLDGVAEVCAVVQRGPRATAVAMRLEAIDGRWQCTALHFG